MGNQTTSLIAVAEKRAFLWSKRNPGLPATAIKRAHRWWQCLNGSRLAAERSGALFEWIRIEETAKARRTRRKTRSRKANSILFFVSSFAHSRSLQFEPA